MDGYTAISGCEVLRSSPRAILARHPQFPTVYPDRPHEMALPACEVARMSVTQTGHTLFVRTVFYLGKLEAARHGSDNAYRYMAQSERGSNRGR